MSGDLAPWAEALPPPDVIPPRSKDFWGQQVRARGEGGEQSKAVGQVSLHQDDSERNAPAGTTEEPQTRPMRAVGKEGQGYQGWATCTCKLVPTGPGGCVRPTP